MRHGTPPINRFLREDFPDVLVARPITATDARGKATAWGSYLNLPCRITGGEEDKFVRDGVEVVTSTKAKVNGFFGLTTLWEYTLPSRYVPTTPVPVHVDTSTDENGPHHQTVYFL